MSLGDSGNELLYLGFNQDHGNPPSDRERGSPSTDPCESAMVEGPGLDTRQRDNGRPNSPKGGKRSGTPSTGNVVSLGSLAAEQVSTILIQSLSTSKPLSVLGRMLCVWDGQRLSNLQL